MSHEAPEFEYSYFAENNANFFGAIGESWQTDGFCGQGRVWQFYDNDTDVVYVSSVDSETWSTPTKWITTHARGYMCLFDLCYDESSNKLHTVYAASSPPLLYRRGTPDSDGAISWDSWQNVRNVHGMAYGSPSICLDSNGYPWIGTTEATDWEKTYPYVAKSSTKNGTWTGEFFTQLNSTRENWQNLVLPLNDGKILAIYAENDRGWVNPMFSRLYNGSGWESEELIASDSRAACFGATSYKNEAYVTWKGKFRSYVDGSGWGNVEYIGSNTSTVLSADLNTGNLYRFGCERKETSLFMQRRINATWGELEVLMNYHNELGHNKTMIGCWRYGSNRRTGFIFSSQDSAPYKHYFSPFKFEVDKEHKFEPSRPSVAYELPY